MEYQTLRSTCANLRHLTGACRDILCVVLYRRFLKSSGCNTSMALASPTVGTAVAGSRCVSTLTQATFFPGQHLTGATRSGAGGGGAISWFLLSRGTVAAGKTEAEYIALSEVLLRVLFVQQKKERMVPELKHRPNHEGRSKSSSTNHLQAIHRVSYRRDTLQEVRVLIHYVEAKGQHTDLRRKLLELESLANNVEALMNIKAKY